LYRCVVRAPKAEVPALLNVRLTCHWLLVVDSAAVAPFTSSPLTLATSSRYFSPVVVLHETICLSTLSQSAESV